MSLSILSHNRIFGHALMPSVGFRSTAILLSITHFRIDTHKLKDFEHPGIDHLATICDDTDYHLLPGIRSPCPGAVARAKMSDVLDDGVECTK
jgi:hypothetical protein